MNPIVLQFLYPLFWIAVLSGVAYILWLITGYQDRRSELRETGATQPKAPLAPAKQAISRDFAHEAPVISQGHSYVPNVAPAKYDEATDVWGVAAAQVVQTIKLSTLVLSDNILVVGQKGSGKTTLLRKAVALRKRKGESIMALDPHASPDKWPCATVGGGRNYDEISRTLVRIALDMDSRFKELSRGEKAEGEFARRSVISDEYRSIADELNGKKDTVDAGRLLLSRISEGRKVGECALVACHNDTTEALGIQGNADMKTCFDYIIYMGALVESNRTYKAPIDIKQAALKLARPAIAWHPERNNWYVLEDDIDMAELEAMISSNFIELPNTLNSGSVHQDAISPLGSGSPNPKSGTLENPNLSIDEVVKVSKVLELYRKSGNKIETIERVFKVSRGGSKEYMRAKFIVDMVLEKEKSMVLN